MPGVWGVVLQIYLGCVLAGCSQPAEEVAAAVREPAEVIVEPVQLTLQAGGEAWLSAQANDASGQPIGGASFRFTPADAAVLKVSGQGLVTALGPVNAGTIVFYPQFHVAPLPFQVDANTVSPGVRYGIEYGFLGDKV